MVCVYVCLSCYSRFAELCRVSCVFIECDVSVSVSVSVLIVFMKNLSM